MLHVHRAERADGLADGLAAMLLAPLEDPFAVDIVAVPTRGIERWLTQRLSTRLGASPGRADGVCANVEFPFPGRLLGGALAAASGIEPDDDPWLPERAVWPLLEVVDESLHEPWLATLARHLAGSRGDAGDPTRRFGVVRHVADLFDRYGVNRPEMIESWIDGGDAEVWQAELWRRLRHRLESPSPAERLRPACARLRSNPSLLELPARLSLFGLTRIPKSHLDVLAALAAGRDVHLFVLHPSPALWDEIAQMGTPPVRRAEDPTAALPANRLLASWGRDVRELQLVLGSVDGAVEHHHPLAPPAETLLSRIQADVRADRQPAAAPLPGEPDRRPRLHPSDRSLQIHACHGRARQVEVLRDAILHLLAEDPTLEPRDVIVMCPDIETFAPLIHATFGEVEQADLPDLRVRLADRSLRQTNPVLGVVSQMLALADQRATASQLLDFASNEPVRHRFGLDDDDLARMQDWAAASGIRWGFDAAHREPFKLASVGANTWRRGLDRILTGVAMTEDDRRLIGVALPLDDVESGAIELAGRMAEYVERAQLAMSALNGAKPVAAWASVIADAADSLTVTSERDSWQRRELQRLLDDIVTESGRSGAQLELGDIRALLADRLRGRPTRANFRTGHLTVCTLVPMRSVPHRVVCVLGLDDGEFPRRSRRDGDDLMLADEHVGDRDPRAEDRQMLLDALLAATERLIITYTGNDERTNLRRPPAVPVGELLDTIDRTVRGEGERAREQVLVGHPLQPFDPRNFAPGTVVPGTPWGFDRHALAGARALAGPRRDRTPFLSAPLPPQADPVIELDRLVRFAEQPARALLRDRLGIAVGESFDEVHDSLPVQLDALAEWGVGQRLLEGALTGAPLDACMRAEVARGTLPPGELARPVLARVRKVVQRLAAAAPGSGGESLDVNVVLPDGRVVTGTVTGVSGDAIVAVSYSRVRPRDRLRAWVKLLALSAARAGRDYEAVVIGRARRGAHDDAEVTTAHIASPGASALEHLVALVDLYDRGMREPLPLACDTSAAYAEAVAAGRDGEAAGARAWKSTFDYDKEDRHPEHRLVYGGQVEFARLLAEPPREDERWVVAEPSRFGQYARRLWDPLLSHEAVSDR